MMGKMTRGGLAKGVDHAAAGQRGQQESDSIPRAAYYIVGNEAAERFSYYGMRSILMLYMVQVLGMSEVQATETMHIFISAVYFLPLLGGWIADRYVGRYWTILIISLFYCLGHAVLSLTEGTLWGLYIGLALIAFGAGGIKPCVSAFLGDQFGPEKQHLLPKVYGMFYWAINFGSFFAFLFIPSLKDEFGYRWAFAIPGLAMAGATLIFWLGSPFYVRKPPSRQTGSAGFWKVVLYAIRNRHKRAPGQDWLAPAYAVFSEDDVKAVRAVLYILLIFAAAPMFWALFDQTTSTWIVQGEQMERITLFGYVLTAEKLQSLNPLLVMIFIPLFTGWLYPWMERLGLRPTPLRRMTFGIGLASLSYLFCALFEYYLDSGYRLSVLWQAIPYLILTAAEVLFSTTGLEFAFSQAPANMKSIVTSFWLLTVTAGNLLITMLTKLIDQLGFTGQPEAFATYALLCMIVAVVFGLLARSYTRLRRDAGL